MLVIQYLKKLATLGHEHATNKMDRIVVSIINQYTLLGGSIFLFYAIWGLFNPYWMNLIVYSLILLGLGFNILILYLNKIGKVRFTFNLYAYVYPVIGCVLLLMYGLKASLFSLFLFVITIILMNTTSSRKKVFQTCWLLVFMLIGVWGSFIYDSPYLDEFTVAEDLGLCTAYILFYSFFLFFAYSEFSSVLAKLKIINTQLVNKSQDLRDFSYIVSHDLKAPLRGIGTLAEMMREDYEEELDDTSTEMLELLESRVGKMSKMIDGVLCYSKLENTESNLTRLDLRILVDDVIDLLAPPEHISIEVPRNLPVIVNDDIKIRQVFQNFISNAIKYNDKAQGLIKVHYNLINGFHEFCIEDNGQGIPKRFQNNIFRIFQTGAQKESKESTGVGLSIVKKIINNAQGNVWLESEEGKGTKFYFTLPS